MLFTLRNPGLQSFNLSFVSFCGENYKRLHHIQETLPNENQTLIKTLDNENTNPPIYLLFVVETLDTFAEMGIYTSPAIVMKEY